MNSESEDRGDDPQLDAAFAAYLRSCDSEDSIDRETFLAQFPELEPELRRLIKTADLLQQFATRPEKLIEREIATDAETIGAAFTGSEPSRSIVTRGRGLAAIQPSQFDKSDDPNATLPADDRPVDHPGPRLPFDLGDYQLQKMIGRGGMGVVYLARQKDLDRQVAVKMIRSGMLAGDEEVRRFRAEARAAGHLKHPNIVTVHHFGYLEGHHYFSMDFVPGTDLARKLAVGQMPIRDCARYVRDCARAIHYAHQQGILHRDLKPANVLIDEQDQVRITDFGLAKHTDNDSSVTASGTAVGTPNYMSPEQASGHGDRATKTADVYSLGAILFALLTGRPPFQAESVVQTLMQVVHRPAPSPREFRPEIPVDLETVVLKCLEKEANSRYPTALALADDLDRFLNDRPVEAKARGTVERVWNWVGDVPIVAALTGRRLLDASQTHRRVQSGMLSLALLIPLLIMSIFAWIRWSHDQMPGYVRIAGGIGGGLYDEFSGELAYRISLSQGVDATVISTDGSLDNRQRLLSREVLLAPMQSSAIRGENLCVVAPLFYEVVHVLARKELGVKTVDDLRQKRVAVGPEGSGSRIAADLLFDSYNIDKKEITTVVTSWSNTDSLQDIDAAIVCIGIGSTLVKGLLDSHNFELIPIEDSTKVSIDHPTLRPINIDAAYYTTGSMPESGIESVGMTAFLATRTDAPAILVTAALDAIYADPPITRGMIPRRGADEYLGMQLHPAARIYFDR